jgi:putative transposase
MGDTWHLDELFVTVQGRQQDLWRAVDEDGDVIDIWVQANLDRRAAARFFRKLLREKGRTPRRVLTDKLRSHSAAHRTAMPSVVQRIGQYENNRAEVSHQPTRQRERQIRRFKSAAQAQRFLVVHGVVLHLFRVGRHLLRAVATPAAQPVRSSQLYSAQPVDKGCTPCTAMRAATFLHGDSRRPDEGATDNQECRSRDSSVLPQEGVHGETNTRNPDDRDSGHGLRRW